MISLTGPTLLGLCAALAVATPVATLLCWSRVRGGRALRIAQRAGLLAVAQLTAVLLLGVGLNDFAYFYSSWHSLFAEQLGAPQLRSVPPTGTPRAQPEPTPRGHIVRRSASRPVPAAEWPTRGRTEQVTITGAVAAQTARAIVYLPPQYFQPAYAHRRFAAVEVLTDDLPASVAAPAAAGYPAALRELLAAHRAPPTVLVLLDPAIPYPRDTECTDVPAGPQALTFLAVDVPTQVSRTYRVQPIGWGAIGTGTGGYCAAKLALSHPRVFAAAVSVDGYVTARPSTAGIDLWAGSTVLRHGNDLVWRLEHLPPPPVSLLVVSPAVPGGTPTSRDIDRFVSLARPPLRIAHAALTTAGPAGAAAAGRAVELAWLCARIG